MNHARLSRHDWLISAHAIWLFVSALLLSSLASAADRTDSELWQKLEELRVEDSDAKDAFIRQSEERTGSVVRYGDEVFAAFPDRQGNIITRVRSGAGWSDPVNATNDYPRRVDENWDQPRLVTGPDETIWLVYRSQVRRRLFLHRWLGEQWGPRIDGPAIHFVSASASARFEEELRPIDGYMAEGSRVHEAIQFRLVSTDDPARQRIASFPIPKMTAAPGNGVIFIDTLDVSDVSGAGWRAHIAGKHPANPVLTPNPDPDAPDTVRIFNRGTVRIEDGKFRMWYASTEAGSADDPKRQGSGWQTYMHVCYAESEDGIKWNRPELGLVEYNGSKRNHLIPEMLRIPVVIYDDREPDPQRRYKSIEVATIAGSSFPKSGDLLTSGDGLRWRKEPAPRDFPGARPWYCEFHCWFRDDRESDPQKRWKAYGSFATGPSRRASHLCTSPDGIHWTGYPDNPIIDPLRGVGHCIHDFIVWQESGRYVGLLQVGDEKHVYEWELVTSRDGVHFSRVADGLKFIGRSPEGQWDHGGIQASSPVQVGQDWWFYYGAFERPWSKYPAELKEIFSVPMNCGIASIGIGRYAGFTPDEPGKVGTITTRPISVDFDRELSLQLNVKAGTEDQAVRVAVIDAATGEELPSYGFDDAAPIHADGIAEPVRWRDTAAISLLKEKPVRLRFELKGLDTELFGFRWVQ